MVIIGADTIEYLAKALEWAQQAPETNPASPGLHFYVSKITVVCEGDTIGYLINEDPQWVYQEGE